MSPYGSVNAIQFNGCLKWEIKEDIVKICINHEAAHENAQKTPTTSLSR
jgi:hypothetical protein